MIASQNGHVEVVHTMFTLSKHSVYHYYLGNLCDSSFNKSLVHVQTFCLFVVNFHLIYCACVRMDGLH